MDRALAFAMLLAVACHKHEAPPTEQLYTDAEIAAATTELGTQLDATGKRHCVRPVLVPPATPGTAITDMLALFEPTTLAPCTTQVHALADFKQQLAARTPAILGLERSCGAPLEAAVRAAIAHEDACSPYQVGQRALAEHFVDVIQVIDLLGLRAELAEPAAGLDLALALLRFAQDLGRGHIGLIGPVLGAAMAERTVDRARAILDKHPPAAVLDHAAALLDVLLASEPPFGDAILAEGEQAGLHQGLAALQPATWVPPGGWGGDHKPDPVPGLDPLDYGGLMLATSAKIERTALELCPPTASLLACTQGLGSIPPVSDAGDPFAVVGKMKQEGGETVALRTSMVEQLAGWFVAGYANYANRRARMTALLATLRVHVEILRTIDRTAHCPTVDDAHLAELGTPAALGTSLTITMHDKAFQLGLPIFVTATGRIPWLVACP